MTSETVVPLRRLSTVPDVAGDHLNAQRFLAAYGARLRRSPELGRWYEWNGAWWSEDRLDHVLELAADTIDALRPWVAEADSADEMRRRAKHYEMSCRAGRRDGLLAIAGTDPDIVVAVEQLDSHPLLLACRNGTVDLSSGALRPPDPDDLLTRGIAVDYDPDAHSEEWERFIDTIFASNADLIAYVQRLLGYCITGVVHEHVLPVLHGTGANGKSTLVGVVQDLLGDHAITAPDGLVIRLDHQPHPERVAVLRGRRLVVSSELEQRATLAEQVVKMLTGGDTLTARELYGRRFNFSPSHKIVLLTNHRPKVRGTDHAIWRRIRLVPFDVTIPDDQQDADLRRRLVEDHGKAVLAWLVRGAVAWQQSGLGHSEAVDAATAKYRQAEDTIGTFLAERTVEVPLVRTKVGDLWTLWKSWCEEAHERCGRQQDFRAALEERGIVVESYQGQKYARDLGIREVGGASWGLTP